MIIKIKNTENGYIISEMSKEELSEVKSKHGSNSRIICNCKTMLKYYDTLLSGNSLMINTKLADNVLYINEVK